MLQVSKKEKNMNKTEKLISEIDTARTEYRTDGYPISIGEIKNMYESGELIINPAFQRYFRWTEQQKTNLIESIILGIPIPSLFVYQRKDGIWELVDGLQRTSTILQFMNVLKNKDNEFYEPLILKKTKYLPSLENVTWNGEDSNIDKLPDSIKLYIKRAKLNFTIILGESGEFAKYEVFQRLNTGGSFASNQEVRNVILIMVNNDVFTWLNDLANNDNFLNTISITERLENEQYHLELVLRYIGLLTNTYDSKKDVKEFLDDTSELILRPDFDLKGKKAEFEKVFKLIDLSLNDNAFKKFNGSGFKGKFLESAYEAVVIGLGSNIEQYSESNLNTIVEKVKAIWTKKAFTSASGSGSNAKYRIPKVTEFAKKHFSL